ncbi:MAG: PEP-CTERM sorting domain-containing protein [Pirellulales bacterium]|nr:PEP-CTERM sorting domain-containing protein [Pirellulales bacterium]
MVDTNVAYMKPVQDAPSGAAYFQPTNIYGAGNWEPVLVDDIWYQVPENYLYINRNVDAYFRIDLTGEEGVTLDLNSLQLFPGKVVLPVCSWHPYLTGCYIEAGDTVDCDDYSMEIPAATLQAVNGGNGKRFWTVDLTGWNDVRYIRVRDTVDVAGVDDDLRMIEMRVRADVPGYANFIGNVTVGYDDARALSGDENGAEFAEPQNMVNNVGMTDQGGAGVGSPTAKSISSAGQYCSVNDGSGAPAVVTFDLHGSHELDEMLVWNYSNGTNAVSWNNRSTKEVTLEYSNDGGTTWTTMDDTNGTDPGTHTFASTPLGEYNNTEYRMYDYQTAVDFEGITATNVRMTQLSNYGGEAGTFGLNEVRFYQVPEPSTSVGLIGLGLLCLVGRRRR